MMRSAAKSTKTAQANYKLWTANKEMTTKPASLIRDIEKLFKASENKTKAESMGKYMRNQFEFFGLPTPERRLMTKKYTAVELSQGEVYALVSLCWEKKERDFQYFAAEYLHKRPDVLLPRNDNYDPMELLKAVVVNKSWWDTIDLLATKVIGHLAVADKDHTLEVLEDWIESENLWLQRCAILYQLSYKKNTDQAKLFRYCLACCTHKDFFIQKAIGWALREYAKTNPKAVQRFVKANTKKLAPLSVREALKHFK